MQDCYIAWLLRLWKIDDLYSFSLFMCIFVDLRIMHYACPLILFFYMHSLNFCQGWNSIQDEEQVPVQPWLQLREGEQSQLGLWSYG